MTPLGYVEHALEVLAERRRRFLQFDLFENLHEQLLYLRSRLLDPHLERAALHRISLGASAVKEFEETDPELARALKDAHYVAVRTASGLKVDLP